MRKQKLDLLIDFDGVIHNTTEFEEHDCISGSPTNRINEAIQDLRKDYNVIVFSTRCIAPGGMEAIEAWLKVNHIEVDGITDTKLDCCLTIDDRCICFDGEAAKLPDKVRLWKHWRDW